MFFSKKVGFPYGLLKNLQKISEDFLFLFTFEYKIVV